MSLIPARHRFTIWKGATFRVRLRWLTGTDPTSPAQNLEGYGASLVIRDPRTHAQLIKLTNVSGISLGGAEGTIDLFLSAETTEALTWTSGVYELLLTSSSGTVDPVLWGPIVVRSA